MRINIGQVGLRMPWAHCNEVGQWVSANLEASDKPLASTGRPNSLQTHSKLTAALSQALCLSPWAAFESFELTQL